MNWKQSGDQSRLTTAAFVLLWLALVALAILAEASVRRLSYAGAIASVMIVATVGLSLYGIHLLR